MARRRRQKWIQSAQRRRHRRCVEQKAGKKRIAQAALFPFVTKKKTAQRRTFNSEKVWGKLGKMLFGDISNFSKKGQKQRKMTEKPRFSVILSGGRLGTRTLGPLIKRRNALKNRAKYGENAAFFVLYLAAFGEFWGNGSRRVP